MAPDEEPRPADKTRQQRESILAGADHPTRRELATHHSNAPYIYVQSMYVLLEEWRLAKVGAGHAGPS